jgi:transposase
VIVRRAYKHKLAPSAGQESLARRIAGCCRLVYNSGLEQRRLGYAVTGRGIGYKAHTYHLKEAKAAPEFAFLKEAPAHCLQQALRDLDDAYRRFFMRQNRYPRLRRRGESDSFGFPDPDPKQIGVHQPGRHNLNRSILDQCWAEMARQVAYKCAWSGGELWKVPAYHSSNECRACGHVDKGNRESQAVFLCTACGREQHADINAAQVVLHRAERGQGILVVAGPSGGTPGCGSHADGEARNRGEDP